MPQDKTDIHTLINLLLHDQPQRRLQSRSPLRRVGHRGILPQRRHQRLHISHRIRGPACPPQQPLPNIQTQPHRPHDTVRLHQTDQFTPARVRIADLILSGSLQQFQNPAALCDHKIPRLRRIFNGAGNLCQTAQGVDHLTGPFHRHDTIHPPAAGQDIQQPLIARRIHNHGRQLPIRHPRLLAGHDGHLSQERWI